MDLFRVTQGGKRRRDFNPAPSGGAGRPEGQNLGAPLHTSKNVLYGRPTIYHSIYKSSGAYGCGRQELPLVMLIRAAIISAKKKGDWGVPVPKEEFIRF